MPYQRNSDLPDSVRSALPKDAQTRFREVVNSALARGLSESKAFASAWTAVKNGWEKDTDGEWVRKAAPRPLFLQRKLENAAALVEWAKEQGFTTTLRPKDIHVTVAYSKDPTDWPEADDDQITVRRKTGRTVEALGDKGAVVLRFESPTLERRWQEILDGGGSWDFEGYKPHVTLTWNAPKDLDLSEIKPYAGELVFGPEIMRELDPDWTPDKITEKVGAHHTQAEYQQLQQIHDTAVALGATCGGHTDDDDDGDYTKAVDGEFTKVEGDAAGVLKISDELGIVFGYAIICKIDGKDYYDTQHDHIPEHSMMKAATEFMLDRRIAKEMHFGDEKGKIVFAFPLTAEIAKAMDIETKHTGLIIGMKPDSPSLLQKFRSGEYTGFSIGGTRIRDKEAE